MESFLSLNLENHGPAFGYAPRWPCHFKRPLCPPQQEPPNIGGAQPLPPVPDPVSPHTPPPSRLNGCQPRVARQSRRRCRTGEVRVSTRTSPLSLVRMDPRAAAISLLPGTRSCGRESGRCWHACQRGCCPGLAGGLGRGSNGRRPLVQGGARRAACSVCS